MPLQPAAPAEADAPRHLARVITHARIPAALKLLLLALLAGLSLATPAARRRSPWHPSPVTETAEGPDSVQASRALHALLRLRAWIGWLLGRTRATGMPLSGHRAPAISPARAARAPPWPAHAPFTPNPSPKPRAPRR